MQHKGIPLLPLPARLPAGQAFLECVLSCLLAVSLLAPPAFAAGEEDAERDAEGDGEGVEVDTGYLLVRDLMEQDNPPRRAAAQVLIERGDPSLVPGIVDALFWIRRPLRTEAVEVLRAFTGRHDLDRDAWPWVEVVGAMDVEPATGYAHWKSILLGQIDPRYREIIYAGVPTAIRLEEVVSGGVPVEGIPTIDDPVMVAAGEAGYLRGDELIFGVDLELPGGGRQQRAYPLRFLDWHEMLNDVVGPEGGGEDGEGLPITLSYCTLCGSGVLYAPGRTSAGEPRRFGTSGLLYRSNKLMIERGTNTLWSNLLGEPVIGEGVGSGASLRLLPHTRSTWAQWQERHPGTLVMDLSRELKRQAAKYGFRYLPGEADEARKGVSFPVWRKSERLERDEEIYALRRGAASLALPVEDLYRAGLVHATLGDLRIVVLADAESGAVRAYEAADARLRRDASGRLVDADGRVFAETEGELRAEDLRLPRLPGHFAYWFGWYGMYPQTHVWSPPSPPPDP